MNLAELHEAFRYYPYCNEKISILIDPSLSHQQYIEDCEVCCRPITVSITWNSEESVEMNLLQENEISCG